MKKYLVLLSVIAVLALTVTAFAATTVELNGDIRIRAEINDNLSDFRNTDECNYGDCSDHNSSYNTRVRLGATATVSPNTYGVIELESGQDSDDTYEVANGKDTYTWGDSMDSKRGAMTIRQAYISHSFGKAATLHAGHMLLSLGNKLFFDHTKFGDDAIALIVPVGDGNLTLLTIKLIEAETHENDDIDAYVLAYGTPIGKVNLSADVTHLRWHNKDANEGGNRLTNIGVRADADLGGAKIKGDVEYQFGKFGATCSSSSCDDTKARGYAATLGAVIPAGPVSVRANVAYGSGDKIDTDDKYEGYINFLGDNQYYTYIYEYKAITAAGDKHTGLNNTWYLNAGVTAKPMTDLTLSGDLYYLQAVKKVSNANDMDKKDIGVELDAKATLQLDTNLVYYVEAGYLWAGDFYANVTGDKSEIDNPFSVRQGLQLTF
jgi:hypothetical protein